MSVEIAPKATTNGVGRRSGGAPDHVTLPRNELVGLCMDFQALAHEAYEAIHANGYSIQNALNLLPGPERDEIQGALHEVHERLVRMLNHATVSAGKYDHPSPAS